MESGLSQSSLSNEPLAVPGKSKQSNSFLSSSQVGFPLEDWGRARKGSVALVDDHCRCNWFLFFFLPFWSECFSMVFYGAPKASIHSAFRFSKNEFAVLDTKRPREPGVALALDPHPQNREFTQIPAITCLASRPSRAGGQLLFRPQRTVTPSPAPGPRQSADRSLGLSRPSSCLPLPARRVRASLGLWLALAAPIWGPLAP